MVRGYKISRLLARSLATKRKAQPDSCWSVTKPFVEFDFDFTTTHARKALDPMSHICQERFPAMLTVSGDTRRLTSTDCDFQLRIRPENRRDPSRRRELLGRRLG